MTDKIDDLIRLVEGQETILELEEVSLECECLNCEYCVDIIHCVDCDNPILIEEDYVWMCGNIFVCEKCIKKKMK